jgi:hypothetical protein
VRVLSIQVPGEWIVGDVSANPKEVLVIADDVLVVVPLPDREAGDKARLMGASGRDRLEVLDDGPQRTSLGSAGPP